MTDSEEIEIGILMITLTFYVVLKIEQHILETNAGKKTVLSCHRCLINTGMKN
jgi:hypothetical protein